MRSKIKLVGKQAAIFKDRGSRYGDHFKGHTNLGLLWTGVLQSHYQIKLDHPVPAYIVELLVALMKVHRIVMNPIGKDHYEDLHVYMAMVEDAAHQEVVAQRGSPEDKIKGE